MRMDAFLTGVSESFGLLACNIKQSQATTVTTAYATHLWCLNDAGCETVRHLSSFMLLIWCPCR